MSIIQTLNLVASGAIPARTICKLSNAFTAVQATAATDLAIGVSGDVAAASLDSVQVNVAGTVKVTAGAAVAVGVKLMSDATGRAITLSGTGKQIVGIALEPAAAANDVILVLLAPSLN